MNLRELIFSQLEGNLSDDDDDAEQRMQNSEALGSQRRNSSQSGLPRSVRFAEAGADAGGEKKLKLEKRKKKGRKRKVQVVGAPERRLRMNHGQRWYMMFSVAT